MATQPPSNQPQHISLIYPVPLLWHDLCYSILQFFVKISFWWVVGFYVWKGYWEKWHNPRSTVYILYGASWYAWLFFRFSVLYAQLVRLSWPILHESTLYKRYVALLPFLIFSELGFQTSGGSMGINPLQQALIIAIYFTTLLWVIGFLSWQRKYFHWFEGIVQTLTAYWWFAFESGRLVIR